MEDFSDEIMDAKCEEYKDDRIVFIPIKFEDLSDGTVTYGAHFRDKDGSWCYLTNHWDSIPDDDLEFFTLILEEGFNQIPESYFDDIENDNLSIMIGKTLYSSEQLEHCFEDRWE